MHGICDILKLIGTSIFSSHGGLRVHIIIDLQLLMKAWLFINEVKKSNTHTRCVGMFVLSSTLTVCFVRN